LIKNGRRLSRNSKEELVQKWEEDVLLFYNYFEISDSAFKYSG